MLINTEVILLLSGGIDSTTLLAALSLEKKGIHALSFDYNQKHRIELKYAALNAMHYKVKSHQVVKMDSALFGQASSLTNPVKEMVDYTRQPLPDSTSDVYVPGRNLLFLSHAAAYAEALGVREVYFAANADDGLRFPDCTSEFVNRVNKVWEINGSHFPIELNAPFIGLAKKEIIIKSRQLGVNLQQTISCYAPLNEKECGLCLSCIVKAEAMKQAELQT